MPTQSKNRASAFYCYGFQGKHELIEPTVEDTHNAGELSVDLDPAKNNFTARVVFSFTSEDPASAAGTTIPATVAGNTFNIRRHNSDPLANPFTVIIDLVSTPGELIAIGRVHYTDGSLEYWGDETIRKFSFTHSPGTPFTVKIVDGTVVIDDALDKFAYVLGG